MSKGAIRINPPKFMVKMVVAALSETVDWGLRLLRVPEIWTSTRGEGIRVCVLDTGIDFSHPDLRDAISEMMDFTNSRSGPTDLNGHGTHCAGIIAARANGFGVIGVAPDAELLIGKVLDDNGCGTMDNIIMGIDWAIKQQADIITMSLGAFQGSEQLQAAIIRAHDAGKIIMAAAGNEARQEFISFPARYEQVISVGSINQALKRSNFSNGGNDLDITAPGEEVYSTYKGRIYAKLSGTSMATPFVAGVAALILAKHKMSPDNSTPIHNNQDMLEHLKRNARDLGAPGFDPDYGHGLIDPERTIRDAALMGGRFATESFKVYGEDKSGCVERVYDRERERGADHRGALEHAREVCGKAVAEEFKVQSEEALRFFLLGSDGCVERVYDRERSRNLDHKNALDHARDVCSKALELSAANLPPAQ